MRIRSLLTPFTYVVAVALSRAKVSTSSIIAFSFLVIFLTIFSFYVIVSSLSSGLLLHVLMIAGVFLTGLMDEVIRSLSKMRKMPTAPLLMAKHSDLLLLFGILYVSMTQPYGLIPQMPINEAVYPAIGALLLAGVFVVDVMTRKVEKRAPGIESRAERMFILSAFLMLGVYFDKFLLSVFAGTVAVTGALYVWIFWSRFRGFFDGVEALYVALAKAWKRALPRGLKARVPRVSVPSISTGEKEEEDYDDYDTEEPAPGYGHNFTTIVNDRLSEPVSNVKVTLLNEETGETYTGETDQSGRANFVGTSEGQYTITLEGEGFKDAKFERYISMDSGEVFVLKRPFSDLSIVVSDIDRTAQISNARVSVTISGSDKPGATRKTDNLGVAYFEELDMGKYEIHVRANGYCEWKRAINLEEENVVSANLELLGAGLTAEAKAPEPRDEAGQEPVEVKQPEPRDEAGQELDLSGVLTGPMLLEYSSPGDVTALVSRIVDTYGTHDIGVLLVSTQKRAEEYEGLQIEIINLLTPDVQGEIDEASGISMSELHKFKTVLERMPAGGAMIFEPLSNLILTTGFDNAFKFVSKTLDYMEKEGLSLLCFLNPSAHDEKEVEKFRSLLKSVGRIEGNELVR